MADSTCKGSEVDKKVCGIVGICAVDCLIRPSVMELAMSTIRHRGPDDEGYIAYDIETGCVTEYCGTDSLVRDRVHIRAGNAEARYVVFGHRRLSIIDPTVAGHQPMSYKNDRYWIVYNGEIYNYIEIRQELERKGYTFSTKTDTEVVLSSYMEWGTDCLCRFNGMWSFAILDRESKCIFAARDRFGVKPFFYTWDGKVFGFASEIKTILKLPGVHCKINEGRAYDYLMWGILPSSEETFFQGVQELPHSHYLILNLQARTLKKEKYYSLEFTDETGTYDRGEFDKHVEKVRDLVSRAVRLRLRADVPIGTCLSGGIDSSAIVCTIADVLRRENIPQVGDVQRVYTACYDDSNVDESRYAAIVVENTKSRWFRTNPAAKDLWNDFRNLVYSQDEPFGSTGIYAQYRVMQLAKESGVKVLLDGQGGDEVFGGYKACYPPFFIELLRRGKWAKGLSEWIGLSNAPLSRTRLLVGVGELLAVRWLSNKMRVFVARSIRQEGVFLKAGFTHAHHERDEQMAERAGFSLNDFLYQWLTKYSLPELLRYEDRNSMAWSIEARTPFADDHPLIEYVAGIPSVYKINNGVSKSLLRDAMRPILPSSIYRRTDKLGFATPQREWLQHLGNECLNMVCRDNQFVDVQRLQREYQNIISRGSSRAVNNLWRLVIFSIWRNIFNI